MADRLKFITGLEAILFDPDMKKRLKERTQLHKILESNTWIFGEEFNLWVSDRSLTEVLRQHREQLDPEIVIDEPVKHVIQERGVVDLMLSRAQKKHRAEDFEHLVVELKAPRVVLKAADVAQIEGYAASVAADPRFRTVADLRWYFWLVGDEYNDEVKFRLKGHPEGKFGIVNRSDNIAVGVKTWAQIIADNRARLQFFQEKLEHRIDQSGALKALQQKHEEFLEGVMRRSRTERSEEPAKTLRRKPKSRSPRRSERQLRPHGSVECQRLFAAPRGGAGAALDDSRCLHLEDCGTACGRACRATNKK